LLESKDISNIYHPVGSVLLESKDISNIYHLFLWGLCCSNLPYRVVGPCRFSL
jgi:hypothetical protein